MKAIAHFRERGLSDDQEMQPLTAMAARKSFDDVRWD
jgi:hypothetical protein